MCFPEGVRGDQSQSFNKGKLSACLLLTSAPGEETRAQGRQGGTEPVWRLKSPTKKATESGRSTCHTSPPTPAAGLSVVSVSSHPVSFQQILATQTHHLCIPVLNTFQARECSVAAKQNELRREGGPWHGREASWVMAKFQQLKHEGKQTSPGKHIHVSIEASRWQRKGLTWHHTPARRRRMRARWEEGGSEECWPTITTGSTCKNSLVLTQGPGGNPLLRATLPNLTLHGQSTCWGRTTFLCNHGLGQASQWLWVERNPDFSFKEIEHWTEVRYLTMWSKVTRQSLLEPEIS